MTDLSSMLAHKIGVDPQSRPQPVPAPAEVLPHPVSEAAAPAEHQKPNYTAVGTSKSKDRGGKSRMPDLGIVNQLMADDRVHDILINGTHHIHVDMEGQLYDTGLAFESEEEVWKLAELIIGTVGHRWNFDRPMVDTRLPDGSRVNIIAPPMAVDGVSISIRKFPDITITLDAMAARGQVTKEIAEFLKICAAKRLNIIVSGGTSSGKTTLLNALSAAISPRERIVTIEDSAELRLVQPHVVRLEAKQPIAPEMPHTGVSIRDLVKNALRMRPDRIIVGESRGPEAFDVLQAMNTGHDGSMTSLHANAPREAISRLETLISLAMPQLNTRTIRQQIASTVHIIIQMVRTRDGQRRISQITEVAGMEGDTLVMQDLMVFHEANGNKPAEHRWVAGAPRNVLVTEAAREVGILRSLR